MTETTGRNPVAEWAAESLNDVYEEMTGAVVCHCRFVTQLVGGQPAGDDDLRAFIAHHMRLEGPAADNAFERIKAFEIGERDTTPDDGELKEEEVYAVKVLRRTSLGPWLGDWMVKAMTKAAASRTNLFIKHHGLKGDVAEGGRVRAIGMSLQEPGAPERIYIRNPGNTGYPPSRYVKFMGRVGTPQGSRSIVHHSEIVDPGAEFEFELRFLPTRINLGELKQLVALMGNIGLGSVKAMECGKFEILSCKVFGVKADKQPAAAASQEAILTNSRVAPHTRRKPNARGGTTSPSPAA